MRDGSLTRQEYYSRGLTHLQYWETSSHDKFEHSYSRGGSIERDAGALLKYATRAGGGVVRVVCEQRQAKV